MVPQTSSSKSVRPPSEGFVVELADGTPVRLRPIRAGDRERLRAAYMALSGESRYLRFWRDRVELDEAMLSRLSQADQQHHVAWAAFDETEPSEPGMGAASFWRLEDDPAVAEVSFTVADAHQGQGVGTLLLALMVVLARRRGLEKLCAWALSENGVAVRWLKGLGALASSDQEMIRLELPLDRLESTSEGAGSLARLEYFRWLRLLPSLVADGDPLGGEGGAAPGR